MSSIRIDKKIIFIHVPKSAGTSISSCSAVGGLCHTKINTIKGWFDKRMFGSCNFDDFFKFAFVRNPWDRFVSWYFFNKLNEADFKETVMGIENVDHPLHLPQYKFVCNASGQIMVDYLGKFENLSADWKIICEKIGIPYEVLPVLRKSEHKDYHYYYDEESKDKIGELYEDDIRIFDYGF